MNPYINAGLTVLGFAVTMFIAYTKGIAWLSKQFTAFQGTLTQHAEQLASHAERMDRYEERYLVVAENLQRIIGRIEEQDRSPWPTNRRASDRRDK